MIRETRKSPRGGAEGMTLLELMIAAGVMAMAFVFMFGSYAGISTASASSEELAIATAHISTVMEEIRGRPSYAALLAYQPPALTGLGVTETIQVVCLNSAGAAVALPTAPPSPALPNPVEVRVMVTWRDRMGRLFRASCSTLHGR